MNYGTVAEGSYLSNAYWYLDMGDMHPCDLTAEMLTVTKNWGFITLWNKLSTSKEVQLFDRLLSDLCNVPLYLVPVIRLQIRLTKA